MPRVLIVGAGLTGCTLGWRLAQEGVETVLLERADVPGGLIRSEHMEGVLYEPHGSHIFHTEDKEVWDLANSMTPFRDYRHRVDIVVEGKILNWPILLSDIDAQSRSEDIKRELEERKGVDAAARAQAANFEEWCLELMGPILLERYINEHDADLVVLTCPLDVFTGAPFGELEWRGIYVRSVHVPHVEYAQGAMVVNYPAFEYPFIRIHETKHASGQKCEGTVLGFEFTNAPTRYYPIQLPRNRELNDRYQDFLREQIGPERTYFAGRLANYLYIDMDDCMRQALDASEEVMAGVRRVATAR